MDNSRSVEDYFTPSAWKLLSDYEKRRYENLQKNYEVLKTAGVTPKIPQFMLYNDQKKKMCNLKNKAPLGMIPVKSGQRTKVKLFGVAKRAKCVKETIEKAENALVLKNLLISSTKDDATMKQSIGHLNRKEFSQIVLTSTRNAMQFLENFLSSVDQDSFPLNKGNFKAAESKSRYPKRTTIQKISYKEEEVSSDDDFLHCDDCEDDFKGACPVHGPMIHVCDTKVKKGDPDAAVNSLPPCLSVSRSVIPKAGLGIWTETPLLQGMVFGPYKGTALPNNAKQAEESGYAWQVWKGTRVHHYVEGADKSESNWMRYVNCARTEDRQNLQAFQFKRFVYYRTYKEVLPFTELLVWYGNEYASDLDIDTKESKELPLPKEIPGYACDVCGSLFSSPSAMEGHRKKHPHLVSDKRHKCPHCPFSTANSGNLRRHLSTHTGERPHTCLQCQKGFTRKSSLTAHLLVHSGEKPHACTTCGKGFNDVCSLRRHERSHTGERRHRCPTCGKDFDSAGHLKQHVLTHTLQRPHRCPHCDYRAARADALRRHIVSVHTKDFKHKCARCEKGFRSPKELSKHEEKAHPEEQLEQHIG